MGGAFEDGIPFHRGSGDASYRLGEPGRNLASAPELCRSPSRYPSKERTLSFELYLKQLLRTMSYNEISAIDNPNASGAEGAWPLPRRFFLEEGERKGREEEGRGIEKGAGRQRLPDGNTSMVGPPGGGARTSGVSRSCVTQGSLITGERTLRVHVLGEGGKAEVKALEDFGKGLDGAAVIHISSQPSQAKRAGDGMRKRA